MAPASRNLVSHARKSKLAIKGVGRLATPVLDRLAREPAHLESGIWGWARVHAECTYRQPLRYEDIVELHLLVRDKKEKAITAYRDLVKNAEDSELVAAAQERVTQLESVVE